MNIMERQFQQDLLKVNRRRDYERERYLKFRVKEQMQAQWAKPGCADEREPACWIIGPSGKLLFR